MNRGAHQSDLVDDLAAIANGDRAAMRRLYGATIPTLYAICLKVVQNREGAEDVLQEVYIKVWNRAGEFDPAKGAPMAWLSLIARNAAIDRVRARMRRRSAGEAPLATMTDKSEPTELRLVRESEAAELAEHVTNLPEPERSYIRDAYLGGMTYSQVADKTGVPLGTVKTRIRRALAELRVKVTRG